MKVESNFEFYVFVYSSKICCCDAYDQCSSKAILLTVAYQKIKVLLFSWNYTEACYEYDLVGTLGLSPRLDNTAWEEIRSDGESLATLFVNRLGNRTPYGPQQTQRR